MDFAPSLALLYQQFGEPALVAGSLLSAVYEDEYIDAGGVQCTGPALRCRFVDVTSVAPGAVAIHRGVNYIVREIHLLPPDGLERRLILERQ